MSGTRDLSLLLRGMSHKMVKGKYVFCSVPLSRTEPIAAEPMMAFREKEGLTLILDRDEADRNALPYNQTWALITLEVHSDLEAVGFLAAITTKLAKHRISTNVVSAFFHDHLFVQSARSREALQVLKEMARKAAGTSNRGRLQSTV